MHRSSKPIVPTQIQSLLSRLTRPQDSNIVLAHTYEYRLPSMPKQLEAAAQTTDAGTVKLDMMSRYLGLVVVPGKYIVRIEVEEFASQMRQQPIQQQAQALVQ